ncbi:hypothetical protein EYC95_07645 [Pseudomonas sp. BGI-2]|nr:hypothetical protein EYC95_07645 [Pseudomonas sp. BGI-2]
MPTCGKRGRRETPLTPGGISRGGGRHGGVGGEKTQGGGGFGGGPASLRCGDPTSLLPHLLFAVLNIVLLPDPQAL